MILEKNVYFCIKFKKMSVAELKISIHSLVEGVQDENLLLSFNDLLRSIVKIQKQTIVGYNADFEPISINQLEKEALERIQNVKSGQFMSQQQMLDSIENKFN
jgi:hypothetical protein